MGAASFGRYVVEAEIGAGAMGRVYRAFDPLARRVVAIKTLKPEVLTSENREEHLRRFRREAQAAGALSHPAMVVVHDVGEDYFVMEYLQGVTLQALLRTGGRLPPEQVLALLGPVADALDHAHARGVVHRDVKPANIMVLPDGRPKVMDFGVAHFASSVMTSAGALLGTPSYMSPEQIAGGETTPATDQFSLATVAYEMLTGRRAFEGDKFTTVIYRVLHDTPDPPRALHPGLPPHFDEVFARALAKAPEHRYPSVTAFVAALDRPAVSLPASVPAVAEPARRRRLLPWLGLGGAAAVAAGLLFLAPWRPPGVPARPEPPATAPEPPPPGLEGNPGNVAPGSLAPPATILTRAGVRRRAVTPFLPPTPLPLPAAPTTVPEAAPSAPAAGVREGDLVEVGGDVSAPRKLSGSAPAFAEAFRRLKQKPPPQTSVTVSMVITERGVPTDLAVLESGGPVVDAAVLEAVGDWRFEPARKGGVRVRVPWRQRFTYISR